MTYYLKCTYSKGMHPGERVVEFRVTRPAYDPMMRSDYGRKFCWFVDEKHLVPIDETNALLRLISFSVRENAAGVTFPVSGNHADLRYYTPADSSCACRVPLEDIVERDSPQDARFLYEASGRILKKRDEENRRLMQEVSRLLEKEGRK